MTSALAVAVASLAMGGAISRATFPLAAGVTAALLILAVRYCFERRRLPVYLGVLVVASAIVASAVTITGRVWDGTWDGQWFHLEAVIQLLDGWNPLEHPLGESVLPEEGARTRINSYPAASWLYGTTLASFTGEVVHAKAFSLVLLAAAFFVACAALLSVRSIPPWVAVLTALVAALNPVAVTQVLNHQHDGDLASCLLMLLGSALLYAQSRSAAALGVLVMVLAVVPTIKLTGAAIAVILLAGILACDFLIRRRLPPPRGVAWMMLGLLGGVLFLGFHPYVTNTLRFGHPLHPFLGPSRAETIADGGGSIQPADRLQALTLSAFSRSSHTARSVEAAEAVLSGERLKVPFAMDRSEIQVFVLPDVRIGGFGPLFGAMVLLAAGALIPIAVASRRAAAAVVAGAIILVVAALIVPLPWFARYVPHVWLLPLLVVPAAFVSRSRGATTVALAVVIAGGVQAAGIVPVNVENSFRTTAALKTRLLELDRTAEPLQIDFRPFRTQRIRLVELGIPFEEVFDPRHSLAVFLGYDQFKRPALSGFELVPSSETGGVEARASWKPVHGATRYRLKVIEPPPSGPGGSALAVVQRTVKTASFSVPMPSGEVHLLASACNELGCGPPTVEGPIEVKRAPDRPILGFPEDGGEVDPLSVPFSWLEPEMGSQERTYHLRIDDLTTGERVVDATTEENYWVVRLRYGSTYSATISAQAGDRTASGDEVRFRTWSADVASSPRPIAPEHGTTLPEGQITLSWTPIENARSYEYFVAVRGMPHATLRGTTTTTSARIELHPVEREPTVYSATMRACFRGTCREERDWGPWSIEGGTGVTNFTVRPNASP